jgi:hypothetical protein
MKNIIKQENINVSKTKTESVNLMQGCTTLGHTFNAITGDYATQGQIYPLIAINGIDNPKNTQLKESNADEQEYDVPVGIAYNADSIESIGKTVESSSKSQFSSNLSASASIDARYGQYQGSIDASYSTETTSNNEEYYSEVFDSVSYYNLGLSKTDVDITTTDLNSTEKNFCISSGMQQAFDELEIDDSGKNASIFFTDYGTHVLIGIIMGGQCRYAAYGSQSDFSTQNDFTVNVEAKYMSISGSASFEGEVNGATSEEESEVKSNTALEVDGGDATLLSSDNDTGPEYTKWQQSIPENLAWIDYQAAGTMGLWELCSNTDKSNYLQSVYGQLYGSNYYTFTTIDQHTTLCKDGNLSFNDDPNHRLSWTGKDNEVMVGYGGNINSNKHLKKIIVIAYNLDTGEYITYYGGDGDSDTKWESFYMAPKGSIITGIGMRQNSKKFANLYVWYQQLQLADQTGIYLDPVINSWAGQDGSAQKVNPKNLPIGTGWCADGVTTIDELQRYYQPIENNIEIISGIDANCSDNVNGFNYLSIIQDHLAIDESISVKKNL